MLSLPYIIRQAHTNVSLRLFCAKLSLEIHNSSYIIFVLLLASGYDTAFKYIRWYNQKCILTSSCTISLFTQKGGDVRSYLLLWCNIIMLFTFSKLNIKTCITEGRYICCLFLRNANTMHKWQCTQNVCISQPNIDNSQPHRKIQIYIFLYANRMARVSDEWIYRGWSSSYAAHRITYGFSLLLWCSYIIVKLYKQCFFLYK